MTPMKNKVFSSFNAVALSALTISLLAACASNGSKEAAPAQSAPAAAPAPVAETPKAPAPVDTTIAWKQGKQQDLSEAQSFASKAQSLKIPVTVKTARAQKRDEYYNKTEQLDAMKNVVLRPLALDKIAKNDKIWAEVIRQLGKQAAAANAHEPQQIVVSVTKNAKKNVLQWLNDGIALAGNGQKPDMQVFDAKQAKDTAIFYQPLDQKQFN